MVLLSGVWLHGPSNPLRTCRATVIIYYNMIKLYNYISAGIVPANMPITAHKTTSISARKRLFAFATALAAVPATVAKTLQTLQHDRDGSHDPIPTLWYDAGGEASRDDAGSGVLG